MIMNNNVLWQTKRRRMVGGGGWFRGIWNTVCFHTHHHCYLRYFLLKDTLQIRMVEHGLSTEVFFSTIRQCTRFVRTRERIGMREKKGTIFSFSPPQSPFKKIPRGFYFHTRPRQYLKRNRGPVNRLG